jgi:hypothetical protein
LPIQATRPIRPEKGAYGPDCFSFIFQVLCDRELTLLARVVGALLIMYFSRTKGFAHPSLDGLANKVGRGLTQVGEAMQELVRRGHVVAWFVGTGPKHYQPRLLLEQAAEAGTPDASEPSATLINERGDHSAPRKTGSRPTGNRGQTNLQNYINSGGSSWEGRGQLAETSRPLSPPWPAGLYFKGPERIRAALVACLGEERVRGCLDKAQWDEASGTIIAASQWARDRLLAWKKLLHAQGVSAVIWRGDWKPS